MALRKKRGKEAILTNQLCTELKKEIISGAYPFGTRLPTESEIEEKYGLSRVTVRAALKELVRNGFIVRHPRRGTFSIWRPNNVFTIDPKKKMVIDDQLFTKKRNFVTRELFPVVLEIAENNSLHPFEKELAGKKVLHRTMIKSVDQLNIALVEQYLPLPEGKTSKDLPSIKREDVRKKHIFVEAQMDIGATQFLNLPEDCPVLMISSVYLDKADKPVIYECCYCRGDFCRIAI